MKEKLIQEEFYTKDGKRYEFSYLDLLNMLLDMIDDDYLMSESQKKKFTSEIIKIGRKIIPYSA